MTPTPEQVAQWDRESIEYAGRYAKHPVIWAQKRIEYLALRAMAAQAEADAVLCEAKVNAEYATGKVDHNEMAWTQYCAMTIRANAPKLPEEPA